MTPSPFWPWGDHVREEDLPRLRADAVLLFVAAVLSIIGSCGAGSDGTEYTPKPSQPTISDPGYSDSLCEGDDYLVYDDCQ